MIQLYSDASFGNIFNEIGEQVVGERLRAKGRGPNLLDWQSRANSLETGGGGRGEGGGERGRVGVKGRRSQRRGDVVVVEGRSVLKRGNLWVSSGKVSLT